MKYYRYLYLSDSIKKIDKLKLKLNEHRGLPGIFVISISDTQGQLDIMNASYLKLKYYRKHPPVVVGLTKTYDEAVDIIIKMVNESMDRTGECDLIEYLKIRSKSRDFTIDI